MLVMLCLLPKLVMLRLLLPARCGAARVEVAFGEAADGPWRRTGGGLCARRSPMCVSLTPLPCRRRHLRPRREGALASERQGRSRGA